MPDAISAFRETGQCIGECLEQCGSRRNPGFTAKKPRLPPNIDLHLYDISLNVGFNKFLFHWIVWDMW
jgi:hypothetical protein